MDSISKGNESKEFLSTLANGMKVITLFSGKSPEMTLSELAEKSGMHRATVRRIMVTLVTLGYAKKVHNVFRLTPALLNLGFSYLSSLPFFHNAQDILYELSQKTKNATSIAVLDGEDVVYVVRFAAKRILTVTLEIGARLPAHATSTGHVLLAALSKSEVEAYLTNSPKERYTDYTITSKEGLLASFEKVRKDGYCLSEQWLDEGLIAIALPVVTPNGTTIAAFNLVSNVIKTNREKMLNEILPLMKETVQKIQDTMTLQQLM